MFDNLKLKIADKCINKIKKMDPKRREELATKFYFKVTKKVDNYIKHIVSMDELLLSLYGPDSQIYLDWKDKLNVISIDPDRKD